MEELWACDCGGQRKKRIRLETKNIGGGNEGAVYKIRGDSKSCAKIYHNNKGDRSKIIAMLNNNFQHNDLAWPEFMVLDDKNNFKGFTMPYFPNTYEIHKVSSMTDRIDNFKGLFSWHSLFVIAMNYASMVSAIHEKGHLIGDISKRNVRVSKGGRIKIIDCDSFSVVDGGKIYKGNVGLHEYDAPEVLAARSYETRTQETDVFSMAIMIFQLLMLGFHPFVGIGRSQLKTNEEFQVVSNIKSGETPYFKKCGIVPPPFAPSADVLPAELSLLFKKTFVDGNESPKKRPPAIRWFHILSSLRKKLDRCQIYRTCNNPNHFYFSHLSKCPWCEYAGMHKKDPFPPHNIQIKKILDTIESELKKLEILKNK